MTKLIYGFSEGNKDMKSLLGGKGANLAEMTVMGLPVPAGFTITTEACIEYLKTRQLSAELKTETRNYIAKLEKDSGKTFGSDKNPLLVSVRSGSVFSMPGMMDTILNLGLNDETTKTLASLTGNARFSYDCYRRLLQMFADVVFGIDKSEFEQKIDHIKETNCYKSDADLTEDDLSYLCEVFKDIYLEKLHKPFPQNPEDQLFLAIESVFRSWDNPRANIYRKINNISNDLGTAVNIQQMVFGNTGETSGTGVAFTRNPATGENLLFGEYLFNAQGEDVVSGIRTPLEISSLKEAMPAIFTEFNDICQKLEKHYLDMQDIEFTIEKEKLFILQTRNGKRTAKAAFRIATDLVAAGLITRETAISRIEPSMIDQLLHPSFDPVAIKKETPIAKGLPASPGAVSGVICFDSEAAKAHHAEGVSCILVRQETSPEDIEGMIAAKAILTSRGGMTSHAAVVARGMGKCCVAGCESLNIQENFKIVRYGENVLNEGDIISINGSTGEIYLGEIPTISSENEESFMTMMSWAKDIAKIGVRTNADTVPDLKVAMDFGADGVGLTRTEHMFFEKSRLIHMRKLILAENEYDRRAPLKDLLKIQTEDFTELYRVTREKPITIRLLDPPLHEFLPHGENDCKEVAAQIGVSLEDLYLRIDELREVNPMLGHRGCRLAISYPEIYEMQTEAIIKSAIIIKKEGIDVKPEIMIPLIGDPYELAFVRESVEACVKAVIAEEGIEFEYQIGTMIEIPRACLLADEVAKHADFFSFGTNDLTQLTYGFSRDDAAKFLPDYLENDILPADPFQTLDIEGVGQLIKIATEGGRKTKPNLKIGVCGEVGGDPEAVAFFAELGLSYVSCSPFRVPIARLAAAQAALKR